MRIPLTILLFFHLSACGTQKPAARGPAAPEQGFFKQNSLSIRNNTAYYGNMNKDNWRTQSSLLTADILEYQLPQNEETALKQYPRWQDFDALCHALQPKVNMITQQFLSKNFLLYYPINTAGYSSNKAEVVKYHLDKLISCKYKDYWLLYDYLVWMKSNKNSYFAAAKNLILAYAQKSPDASKTATTGRQQDARSSAFFRSNPAAASQLEQMTLLGEQNETYIDKIRML